MKKIVKIILIYMCAFVFVQGNAYAVDHANEERYSLGNNVMMEGVFSTYEWFFYVEETWEANKVQMNLQYVPTQMVDGNTSTLTVFINDEPLHSQKVINILKAQTLELDIPKDTIKKGYNKITIKGYMRLSDQSDTDSVNTGAWLNIIKESAITLSYTEEASLKLSHFPYPFVKHSIKEPVSIVIPTNYTKGELEAALWMRAVLGSYSNQSQIGNIQLADQLDEVDSKNVIWISNEEILKKEYPQIKLEDSQTSLIFIDQSQGQNRLVISGNTEESLERGVKLLMNEELLSQIDEKYYILRQEILIDTVEHWGGKDKLTFEELGYDSTYMAGPYRNATSLFLDFPNEMLLQKGAKLTLKTRYSKNIDFDKSLVTLYINGEAVASSKLKEPSADSDTIDLPIDPRISLRKGTQVTIAFDLEMNNQELMTREGETPWAYIDESSYFYLPKRNVEKYSFDTFPYPFVKENKMQDVTFIVPNELSEADFNILGQLCEAMGRHMESNTGSINLMNENQIDNIDPSHHLIVYGTPKNNAMITTINKKATLKLDETNSYFVGNEEIPILPHYGQTLTVLELRESTVNKDQGMLTIVAPSQENLIQLSKAPFTLPYQLGRIITINNKGEGATYSRVRKDDLLLQEVSEDTESELDNIKEPTETSSDLVENKTAFIFIGSIIGIGILVMAFLTFHKNKKIEEEK